MTGALDLPAAVDALVAILLVVTIVYAVVLNRKLTMLRNAKGEMEAVAAQFTRATAQAENGIQTLKAHATETGATLDSTVKRAHSLVDDLGFLIERGNNLADRLDGAIATGRGKGIGAARSDRPQSPPSAIVGVKAGARAEPKAGVKAARAKAPPAADVSPDETALLNALRGVR